MLFIQPTGAFVNIGLGPGPWRKGVKNLQNKREIRKEKKKNEREREREGKDIVDVANVLITKVR